MIYINEWLSNPSGADSGNEWVELFNSGMNGASLNGWMLVSGNGKKFILDGKNIGAGQYLILNPAEVKMTLRNQDESLSLYDAQGKLASQSSFSGSAPEGKSYSRVSGASNSIFAFSDPTPAAANKIVNQFMAAQIYPVNQPLNKYFGALDVLGLALFVGLIYPFLIIAIFKKNDYLSKLFFGRD
ncbi:MAG TPA: lamin tail domain-containing protein [Candidatus Paceibacterota bacterium]|nr:lamin tail domain-containing protein [Candidatus Paceibacterota bacterium]